MKNTPFYENYLALLDAILNNKTCNQAIKDQRIAIEPEEFEKRLELQIQNIKRAKKRIEAKARKRDAIKKPQTN